jgi:hypothetical protein
MSDRLLFGVTSAVCAVGLLLGIGLLLSARSPYGPAFSHPMTLSVGALAGFSVAVLPRSWPASRRVATALVTVAAAVIAVAIVIYVVKPVPFL